MNVIEDILQVSQGICFFTTATGYEYIVAFWLTPSFSLVFMCRPFRGTSFAHLYFSAKLYGVTICNFEALIFHEAK
jgi:hypothetical protein